MNFKFTKEGLPIDSQDAMDRVIAAMSAAILHISEKYIQEYGCGKLKRILIETEGEILMLREKDDTGILSILEVENGKVFLNIY